MSPWKKTEITNENYIKSFSDPDSSDSDDENVYFCEKCCELCLF